MIKNADFQLKCNAISLKIDYEIYFYKKDATLNFLCGTKGATMKIKTLSFFLSVLIGLLVISVTQSFLDAKNADGNKKGTDVYTELLTTFKMRNIGPANMGGRAVDIAVVESNSFTIYAAIGPSGLWKSTDNGIHWCPVFQRQTSASVGAVAVSRSHPDIIWVGTGEATSRNSVAIGDGVYKSEDGGNTWKNMGLSETRHIDRILIDPHNPDIVYIGAMGHLWGANPERGVFKTLDGGKNWKKVLYFDEDTGIADMAMDPTNSRILYAAAYSHRRKPFHFTSGGPHSGIYKTTDGGETWKQLKNGLPEGVNGRCGIAVSRSQPETIYALVENKEGGIFRSLDKGETWSRRSDKKTYDKVNFRPFYYSKITVDPNNPLVVYVYSGKAFVSEDGAKTFREIAQGLHADHHRIWVDPADSRHIIDGNDGGIDISWDRGEHWYSVQNAAWAECYQVAYDMRDPYYVYTGLQDNGNWAGPSNSRDKKGIMNFHWTPVGGGDGFYTQVDPRDHNFLFRNLQMGNIERFLQSNGQTISIIPRTGLDEEPYRFNWNSPILLSPHNPDILYFGGNFLFKSTNRGDSWEKISPDLSSKDPQKIVDSGGPISMDNTGAEVHCTIYTLAESPLKAGLLWAGTDDGYLWLTRDNGKNWTRVDQQIKGLPSSSWVSRVEASHAAEGRVYVTFDRHRWDDYAPYVYRSDDFGKTWVSLRNNLPKTGYLHVLREDPLNHNLLYLGSEFGLFFSFDGGNRWIAYNTGFPTTAVRDLTVHPRENDLIVGTHGRGVWIMDNITPLQQFSPAVMAADIHLFDLSQATIYFERSDAELYAEPIFSAPNPTFGATIDYYLKSDAPKEQQVLIHLYDPDGNKFRTLEGTGKQGLNRVYWDIRQNPPFKVLPEILKGDVARWFGTPMGPFVLPGTYKIVVEYGNRKLEQSVVVKKDKNLDYPLEEWKENQKYVNILSDLLKKGFAVVYGIKILERQFQELDNKLKAMKEPPQPVLDRLKEIRQKLDQIKSVISLQGAESGHYRRPLKLALQGGAIPEQIFILQVSINKYPGKPTETQKKQIQEILQKATPLFMQSMQLLKVDLPAFNQLLREHRFNYIKAPSFPEDLF
jgi:photosystem II stability/assembly factor-like uncharacterized protein